ncbi:MAG: cytochrome-c peroxidase, partial [Gemmatimonadales bacterium]
VIEQAIYPRPTRRFAPLVQRQAADMRRTIQHVRDDSTFVAMTAGTAFYAARTEVARVATLGLAGFDATESREAIPESADALRGVRRAVAVYESEARRRDPQAWTALAEALDQAIDALDRAPDFDRFDRFEYLARYYRPLASALATLRTSLQLPEPTEPTMWAHGATNIYAAGAIDARWFAPDFAPPPTPALIDLGRELFFSPALSARGRRSCATCHQPALAFTDGRPLALVDPGHGRVRNTPTLLNAGLERHQFADQRVMFLEFQFEAVMANPREMALPHDSAARRLSADSALAGRFAAVFRKPPGQGITGQMLAIAVAAYVRSLQGSHARFDRALAGDTGAVTASERRGFNLFMGKAACATCHFAPLFNGALPPNYLEDEPEVIGVPSSRHGRARVDPDPGVIAASRAPLHRHAFKTPTVRNVGRTAPYMHNGVFRTLDEVVDFYDRGGGNGIGMHLPNQTLSAEPLRLTRQEKRDLVSFLQALTDSAYDRPSAGQ